MKSKTTPPLGVGNWSRRTCNPFSSDAWLDRPLPEPPSPFKPLLVAIGRDVSLLLDAKNESENNVERGEMHLLRLNLKGCFDLARRIQRRRKRARRLLRKAAQ
jgi:hypothetical protein